MKKVGFGRPPKYKKEFCTQVVDLGKKGLMRAGIAAEFGVTKKTISYWCHEHPEFGEAYELAMTYSEYIQETKALNAENPIDFRAAQWALSAYFRVTETQKIEAKQEVDVSGSLDVNVSFADRPDELNN